MQKMQKRTILHSDLNCFYASVEMMLNPELRGKAVAVCGATEDRHGIVLAKSELAKQAGVKTGMVHYFDVCLEGYSRFGFDHELLYKALVDSVGKKLGRQMLREVGYIE